MPRYVAFLRGVSPLNAKMPELKRAFEAAGFTDVMTVISSGNVVFSASRGANAAFERKAEAAMQAHLGRTFLTLVRPVRVLEQLLAADPYAPFKLPKEAKRIVAFLRPRSRPQVELPIKRHDAWILDATENEAFCAYVPSARGLMFMTLIEKTFGQDLTTRTWGTVQKCAAA
jgi:uncharacterized protein (DUF1697 family)